jgi:hypothetical protein
VLLDTGFSTAFNSGDQQNQFMTIALTNLAGLRAAEGADGQFLGVDFSQALSDSAAEAQSLARSSDPSQWDWAEKARQLAQMWSQGGTSADLTNWLAKVRAGRALLTTQASGAGFIASPGLQAVQQFSATVAEVSQNMTPAPISSAGQTTLSPGQTPASADTTASSATMPPQVFNSSSAAVPASGASALPTAAPPAGPTTPSVYSQMLQALVQQVTTQLTTAMVTKLTTPKQSQYPAYAGQNGGQAFGQTNPSTANAAPYSSSSALQTAATQPGQSFASGNASGNADASVNPSNPGSPTAQNRQGQRSASSNAQLEAPPAAAQPQIVYFGPAATIGQNPSLSLQVTNPAATLMSSLQAQLYVDGMPGPAQTLGPLLPSQTQSVTFDSSTLAARNHNIKVLVTTADGASASATASLPAPASSLGADVSKLKTTGVRSGLLVRSSVPSGYQIGTVTTATPSASAQPPTAALATRSPGLATRAIPQGSTGANQGGARVTVLPPPDSSHTAGVRSLPAQGSVAANQTRSATTALPAGGTNSGLAARTVIPSGPSTASQTTTVATVLPPRSNPGAGTTTAVSPGSATTSTALATTVPLARGLPGPRVGAAANSVPGRAYLDLSVAASEIGFRPAAPGQSTTFTAVIHNLGTLGAQGASVVFKLNADGRITSSPPSVFNVPAGGSFQASWSVAMPAGRSVQLTVQVMANGDANSANNQALIRVR